MGRKHILVVKLSGHFTTTGNWMTKFRIHEYTYRNEHHHEPSGTGLNMAWRIMDDKAKRKALGITRLKEGVFTTYLGDQLLSNMLALFPEDYVTILD